MAGLDRQAHPASTTRSLRHLQTPPVTLGVIGSLAGCVSSRAGKKRDPQLSLPQRPWAAGPQVQAHQQLRAAAGTARGACRLCWCGRF